MTPDALIEDFASRMVRLVELPGRVYGVSFWGKTVYAADKDAVDRMVERERAVVRMWLRMFADDLLDKLSKTEEE